MEIIEKIGNKIISGYQITSEEALLLYEQPLENLCKKANELRQHFCSNNFDICTIINGKSGQCSEDCTFCSQSIHSNTNVATYPLLSSKDILLYAEKINSTCIPHLSIVTSGKNLSSEEVDKICLSIKKVKEKTNLSVCGSFGLLNKYQCEKLKIAGISRIHNNLETSRNYYPNICTTHTFEDKLKTIRLAQESGLFVCSGGIIGLGESFQDRIDMAITLKELGIKSIPINILNPIFGTPLESTPKLSQDEILRTISIFRFVIPDAFIRLAGGRGLIIDNGRNCFLSGANATISGDMLTTSGVTIESDLELIKELKYEIMDITI